MIVGSSKHEHFIHVRSSLGVLFSLLLRKAKTLDNFCSESSLKTSNDIDERDSRKRKSSIPVSRDFVFRDDSSLRFCAYNFNNNENFRESRFEANSI